MNTDHILMEARISIEDKVIYTDTTPKSLYEYYINGYTTKDIETLIENLRMDFDVWDKTVNMYRSSDNLMSLSGYDISVLYEDNYGNSFIYAFATKKVYFYDKDQPPFIKLENGLTINEFLEVAKRDFEGLLRTPYGKKYVSEMAVLTEGIKEFFGYGKAIRIFIDGKTKNASNRLAFNEFTYGCIDALVDFSSSVIKYNEYERILERSKTILETYDNGKLPDHDNLRRCKIKSDALISEEVLTFKDILKRFSQDIEETYEQYVLVKSFQLALKDSKTPIMNYLKKNSALGKSIRVIRNSELVECDTGAMDIDKSIENPIVSISPRFSSAVYAFDLSIFKVAYLGGIKNRLERFSNQDIFMKFLDHMHSICNLIKVADKEKQYKPFFYFENVTEYDVKYNNQGICYVYMMPGYYPDSSIPPMFSGVSQVSAKKKINAKLFEAMTGVTFEAYQEDCIKHRMGILHETSFHREISDEEFTSMLINLECDQETFENTMELVFERDLGREIAHNIRSGYDKVAKGVSNVARSVKNVVNPIVDKAKKLLNDIDKENENTDREVVITNSSFSKINRFFKNVALPGVVSYYALGPAKTIVLGLVKWFTSTGDEETRKKIIRELEMELKMTREKIEDAKNDNDRKAKYELMRLESSIEDEIARIKFGGKK